MLSEWGREWINWEEVYVGYLGEIRRKSEQMNEWMNEYAKTKERIIKQANWWVSDGWRLGGSEWKKWGHGYGAASCMCINKTITRVHTNVLINVCI